MEFKLALNEKNWEKVEESLKNFEGSEKKIIIKYLVEKGYASKALDLVSKPEEKFALAIQSSDFHTAL